MKLYSKFKYCPKCSCLDLIMVGKDYKCESCKFIFWQNSKPTVTATIIRRGKVLLGKRSVNPYKGYWDLPGGFLENGEHPEVGLRREMKEELGVEIEIKKLTGVFMDKFLDQGDWCNVLCLHYLCNIKKGEPNPLEEVSELGWFSLNNLPKKISSKSNKKILSLLK